MIPKSTPLSLTHIRIQTQMRLPWKKKPKEKEKKKEYPLLSLSKIEGGKCRCTLKIIAQKNKNIGNQFIYYSCY